MNIINPEISISVDKLFKDKKTYARMAKAKNPYGDGKASERIVKAMRSQI